MSFWQQIGLGALVYFSIVIPALLWVCRQLKEIGDELNDGY